MRLQLILAVVLALSVAGFAGSAASARPSAVSISVDRPVALVETQLRIRVLGIRPHRRVKVLARTRDGIGRAWSSWASFRADRNGRVDLSRAGALAGSYRGTAAMGFFWSMLPRKASLTAPFPPRAVEAVTLSVQVDRRVLTRRRVVRQLVAPGVLVRDQRPGAVGFYGELFLPANTGRKRPDVLLFGGSDGGLATTQEAALLASRGYTSLALAYFRVPGLPRSLSEIPLDYFATALRFLRDQPGVDPAHLVVQSTSRGSEAALLLGVHYPELVHAVIALVPSNVAICSFPGCARSAWCSTESAGPVHTPVQRSAPHGRPPRRHSGRADSELDLPRLRRSRHRLGLMPIRTSNNGATARSPHAVPIGACGVPGRRSWSRLPGSVPPRPFRRDRRPDARRKPARADSTVAQVAGLPRNGGSGRALKGS
jgi:Acyl-CoA thioester hydrolase/BAAT N-terminal region/BAAT / Acyl-CoA thioester hydrolase C terminal